MEGSERVRGHCSRKCQQLSRGRARERAAASWESIAYIAFGDPKVTESFRDYLNGWIDRSILRLSRKGYCLSPSLLPTPAVSLGSLAAASSSHIDIRPGLL